MTAEGKTSYSVIAAFLQKIRLWSPHTHQLTRLTVTDVVVRDTALLVRFGDCKHHIV